ncbi:uncharacterized protein LOC114268345 [Camellia sinensis]|uniref:uncharacterized protein LOC114268345 n=1 Tax=Camellia sinensis TaxID=4442 RepID=UPI001035A471|nr:uncharacterized protein LOC114268345 [Camellia sinensis]
MNKKYQGTARVKRAQYQALCKEFEILHMMEGESINDYFARTLSIANKMRIHGENLEDVAVIKKILRSLTRKFDYIVCSIEESNDINSLSIDVLQRSLLVHEQSMTNHVVEEQALNIITHEGTTSPGRGRGCRGFRGKEKETKVNFAEIEKEMLLMAYIDKKENSSSDTLYLDSGCSNHMCGNMSLFYDLDETFRETLKLGNNSCISVMGKRDIKFHMKNNTVYTIPSVFYIPDLKSNLISMGQLQKRGYIIIIIQQSRCQIHYSKKA